MSQHHVANIVLIGMQHHRNTRPTCNTTQRHVELAVCERIAFKNQSNMAQGLSLRLVDAKAVCNDDGILSAVYSERQARSLWRYREYAFHDDFDAASAVSIQNTKLQITLPNSYQLHHGAIDQSTRDINIANAHITTRYFEMQVERGCPWHLQRFDVIVGELVRIRTIYVFIRCRALRHVARQTLQASSVDYSARF